VLVNTSRGEVVDEAALVTALESGRLAGAALDVIQNERDDTARASNPVLAYAREHDNLLVTPHLAGATLESMEATEIFMARKLFAFLGAARGPAGEPLRQGGTW
jgi:D-3-phosphoglycerate dehydrogenase / 2-oxoglutarate reductase